MSAEEDKLSQLPLFFEEALFPSSPNSVPTVSTEVGHDHKQSFDLPVRSAEQQAIYDELVQLTEEWASTLWIDPLYKDKYDELIALTAARGTKAGLVENDILEAIQTGKERGQALKDKRSSDRC